MDAPQKTGPGNYRIEGDHHHLNIDKDDKLAVKLAMLFEACSIGVQAAITKYGYTEQRYYQLRNLFNEHGVDGLKDKARGPKTNRVRTDEVVNQIIRHRFLDPNASPAVITQKMRQNGYKISQRSVERTITEYGLQKKTPQIKPQTGTVHLGNPKDKKKETGHTY